jgi:hypothetical protein
MTPTQTQPTYPSSTATGNSSPEPTRTPAPGKLSTGAAAGIGIGAAAAFLLCASLVYFILRRRRGGQQDRVMAAVEGHENKDPGSFVREAYVGQELRGTPMGELGGSSSLTAEARFLKNKNNSNLPELQ